MKILTDASIFRRDSLRFQMEKEGCSYYGRNCVECNHSTFLPQKTVGTGEFTTCVIC